MTCAENFNELLEEKERTKPENGMLSNSAMFTWSTYFWIMT
jgi:hypothetical protein